MTMVGHDRARLSLAGGNRLGSLLLIARLARPEGKTEGTNAGRAACLLQSVIAQRVSAGVVSIPTARRRGCRLLVSDTACDIGYQGAGVHTWDGCPISWS